MITAEHAKCIVDKTKNELLCIALEHIIPIIEVDIRNAAENSRSNIRYSNYITQSNRNIDIDKLRVVAWSKSYSMSPNTQLANVICDFLETKGYKIRYDTLFDGLRISWSHQ